MEDFLDIGAPSKEASSQIGERHVLHRLVRTATTWKVLASVLLLSVVLSFQLAVEVFSFSPPTHWLKRSKQWEQVLQVDALLGCGTPRNETLREPPRTLLPRGEDGECTERANWHKYQQLNQVTVSPMSGRRFLAKVVTLPCQADVAKDTLRFRRFENAWRQAWPQLKFDRIFTWKNSEKLRGMGVNSAYLRGLQDALTAPVEFDYVIFFEDDGIPFQQTLWPESLDVRLDELEKMGPERPLLLGGHNVHWVQERCAANASVIPISLAWGAYGVVVSRTAAKRLLEVLMARMEQKTGDEHPIDLLLFTLYEKPNQAYISSPLLVDHATGYSATWGKKVTAQKVWEGYRDFWNFPEMI
mmetsp:Transcript_55427/g.104060  ORF Transcript_55427/g.104060 Transcript_55427/m.104060 type:complete len:357 (+) Transcript_55427:119-1189(+)